MPSVRSRFVERDGLNVKNGFKQTSSCLGGGGMDRNACCSNVLEWVISPDIYNFITLFLCYRL